MKRTGGDVLGSFIDACSWVSVLADIGGWIEQRQSRYVCICNAHSVVTATRDEAFSLALRDADLATPDGAPVAWMLRKLGFSGQERINGPDLMWRCCEHAGPAHSMFLYGGTPETLLKLQHRLLEAFPQLQIVGSYSPPFRSLSAAEDESVVQAINDSGARIVWVSLGCPKQELWMAAHKGRVKAVMIGVGAAFDYHAGTVQRAPAWMQNGGLEWLHRLATEPRRLWRRYLVTNTLFVIGAAKQVLGFASARSSRD